MQYAAKITAVREKSKMLEIFVKPVYFCSVFTRKFGFELRLADGGNNGVAGEALETSWGVDSAIAVALYFKGGWRSRYQNSVPMNSVYCV